jgi:hypothetical protein
LNDGTGKFTDTGQDSGDAHISAVDLNLLDLNGDGHIDAHVVYFDRFNGGAEIWFNITPIDNTAQPVEGGTN